MKMNYLKKKQKVLYKGGSNVKIKKNEKQIKIMTESNEEERNRRLLLALAAFKECGVLGKSAKIAGISRALLNKCIVKYPKFAKKWEEAYQEYVDSLEAICDERARSYSDSLLKFLLTANRKEKYGNASLQQTNNVVNNTQININPANIVQIAEHMAKKINNTERRYTPTVSELAEVNIIE